VSVSPSTRALALIASFFACAAVTGYILFPAREDTRGFTGALAAPSVPSSASEIRISAADEVHSSAEGAGFVLVLRKRSGEWFLVLDDKMQYPVRPGRVQALLGALAEKRTIVRTGSHNASSFGIGSVGSLSLRILGEGEEVLSDIRFGRRSAGGTDIFFSSVSDLSVLRCADVLSEFLDIRAASWARLDIFAEACKDKTVTRIVREAGGKRQTGAIDGFDEILSSFRCLDVTNIPSASESVWSVEFGDTSVLRFSIAPLDGEVWILTDWRTGCSYTISGWAKERLEKAFRG
jgi:hypothetical protein